MILTFNYGDLQDIKAHLIACKIKDNKKIYTCIEAYKQTLNFMYVNKLTQNSTKAELELDLQDFAKKMLANTTMTYQQLEKKYKRKVISKKHIKINEIKLKL